MYLHYQIYHNVQLNVLMLYFHFHLFYFEKNLYQLLYYENLLYQACLKAILTVKGSNPYHPGYGSSIMSRIGQKNNLLAASQIKEDIVKALSSIQNLQNGQMKYQQVTDKERLYRVSSVNVSNTQDPTVFLVDVVVVNGSNKPVSISITYTAPGAVALAGSNGGSLGTEAVGTQRILTGE